MKPLIIANWKSHNNLDQSLAWIEKVGPEIEKYPVDLVVCPSFLAIVSLKNQISSKNFKIFLGAQDVSAFAEGAYTGGVGAQLLAGLAKFCIVGHSERKRYFRETAQDIAGKLDQLLTVGITPILCLSSSEELDEYLAASGEIIEKADKIIFVAEPAEAISAGATFKPYDPDAAASLISKIEARIGKNVTSLYGGSVYAANIAQFLSLRQIDGVLVGQSSVEPDNFLKLLNALHRS